jgi:hypothetical protein
MRTPDRTACVFQAENPNGFQKPQRPERIGIGGVLRRFKADLNVALGSQVIDLGWLGILDDANEIGRIGQVAIVQREPRILLVRVLVEMIDAIGVEGRSAALDAMDDIPLVEEELGQISAVLSSHAGDESNFV